MLAYLIASVLTLADTPEATVQAFVKAYNAHDLAAMGRELDGSLLDAQLPIDAGGTIHATVTKTTLSGEDAYLEVDVEADGASGPLKGHDSLHLRKVENGWRIVPMAAGEAPTIGLVAFLVTDNALTRSARQAARRSACLSNVKQIGLGVLMYAADHDDRLPRDPSRWKAAIMPYVKDEAIFHCPDDPSGNVSYFFDARLAGRSQVDVTSVAETALIVEGTAGKPAFRHRGTCNIAFLDGHAKACTPEETARARSVSLK